MNLVNTLPRNAGVRRLCLIISIILVAVCCLIDWDFHQCCEFYLLTEEEGAWILPLLFVIPFVCCKVIEYIVDGFKQEEKLHEKNYKKPKMYSQTRKRHGPGRRDSTF